MPRGADWGLDRSVDAAAAFRAGAALAWLAIAHLRNRRERAKAESALTGTVEFLERPVASIADRLVTINEPGSVIGFDPAAEAMFGSR